MANKTLEMDVETCGLVPRPQFSTPLNFVLNEKRQPSKQLVLLFWALVFPWTFGYQALGILLKHARILLCLRRRFTISTQTPP